MTRPAPRSPAAREALEQRLAGLSPAKRALLLREAGFEPAPVVSADAPTPAPAGSVPLSFGQEVLWLVEQASPELSVYNVPTAVRVRGAFDAAAFERALARLIARHRVLASRVQLVDGVLHIVEDAAARVRVEHDDLTEASDRDRRAWVTAFVRRPFDLALDLPIRAAIAREGEDAHLVVLVLHHLVSDGWSRGLLFDELSALYAEARDGTPATLPDLPLQYRDFAHWQRQRLDGERLEALLRFWRQQLPSGSEATALPYDRAPGRGRSFAGERVSRAMPAELVASVRALSAESGTSLFVVMLTAFQTLLQRYAGAQDVVVASPVAGRSRPEWETLIGYFSNTLLFRATFDDAPTFRTLLARGRAAALAAFDHDDELPFERLAMDLPPEQRRADGAFFGAMFAMAGGEGKSLRFDGATVSPVAGAGAGARADLYLAVSDRAEGMRLVAEFRSDLFDPMTIERMLAHFEVLLVAAVANPDAPVATLPLLPAAERQQVLTAWQGEALPFDREATLHALVAAQAARTPDAIALLHGAEELTYAELLARASCVAAHLAGMGVGPDVRVGICLTRSNDLVIAILGVLMAGGAYVPLDPAYPPDRNAFMLEDSSAQVVLTESALAGALDGRVPRVGLMGALAATAPADPAPLRASSARHLAYQIYTSGSTGRPKGVMLEHRNAVALVAWARTLFSPEDVAGMLFSTSVCFDLSVFEIFLTLSSGGTLIVADNALALPTLPAAERVTFLNSVPSAAAALIRARAIPSSVRTVVLAGEPLPTATVNDLSALGHVARVFDMYGPTEDTVYSTCALRRAGAAPTIGRPIANSQAYVLEPSGLPAPIGVPGELVLGGAGVARGYHGREELTAEKFVPNPFALTPGARMYRTGDRVRWRADGMLEFLGRLDHQVKIRGFRIEPGEVQAVLESLPGIDEAAVIVRADPVGDKRLLGYVVVAAGAEEATVSDAALRAALRQRLPEHMVPTALTRLARMPRTPNGKLDRAQLPDPGPDVGTHAHTVVPARTTIEHQLVTIWESLLTARPIGIRDDFFALGGHSLLALRMLGMVQDVSGRRLPLAALFDGATIEELAARIERAVFDEDEPPVVVLQGGGPGTPLAFVHGDVRGGGWYCRRMAPLLGPSPMFVLPTLRADGEHAPLTIEAMALQHLGELRKLQPHGPYRLGGFCAGGLIAYEMACRLRAAGEDVERLIIVESSAMNSGLESLRASVGAGSTAEDLDAIGRRLRAARLARSRAHKVRRMTWSERAAWFTRNVKRVLGLTAPVAAAAPVVERPEEFDLRPGTNLLKVQGRAAGAYIPRAYDGEVDLLVAVENDGPAGTRDLALALGGGERVLAGGKLNTRGWKKIASKVRAVGVHASHVGIITEQLPVLAECVRRCLAGEPPAP